MAVSHLFRDLIFVKAGRLQILAFICVSLYNPLIRNLSAFTKIMSRNKRETTIYIQGAHF